MSAFAPAQPVSRRVRAGTMLAVFLVAGVALVASYSHMYDLAYAVGERWRSPLFPLAVDGLVLAAGLVIWARSRQRRPAGFLARFSLALGLVVSVAANVAATDLHTVAAWAPVRGIVVGWAPVAAFLAVHLLFQLARDAGVVPALSDVRQGAAEAPGPVVPPISLESPKLPATEPGAELQRDPVPATDVAESPPPVTERSPKVKPPKPRKPSRTETRRQSAAETAAQVREAAARMPDATPEQIAAEVGTSERTVRRYLPAPPEPAVRPVISLVPAAPAELDVIPDPRHGGDRVPVGAAT